MSIIQEYVKNLKQQMLYEMGKKKRGGIYGIMQRSMAYNSNRIEGNTLTELQTANIFETGTIVNDEDLYIRTKDVEEMIGHFRMFNHSVQQLDQPLSTDLIKQMHYDLKNGVFEDMANGYPCGEFKNRANQVSTITTALPEEVPKLMNDLINHYNHIKTPNIKDLAVFHAAYERIHPFQDGNGRTGRMILFRESLRHGMIPFIIQEKNKAEYMHCLNKVQAKGDFRDLTAYFEKEQQEFYDNTKKIVLSYDTLRKERMRIL